jgi:diaminohydroxyphosphoribosylaminopyrimidine deaminase/5-amino-6-(5-phosphoribosylamino)uracil reductase
VFSQRSKAPTIVATSLPADSVRARRLKAKGVEIWTVGQKRGRLELPQVLERITDAGLRSVLVEGGAQVHASFLRAGLADALYLFLAPKLLGAAGTTWSGPLPIQSMRQALTARFQGMERLGDDLLLQLELAD